MQPIALKDVTATTSKSISSAGILNFCVTLEIYLCPDQSERERHCSPLKSPCCLCLSVPTQHPLIIPSQHAHRVVIKALLV